MSAVVVFESMFGSTRRIAEAITRGMERHTSVALVNVNTARPEFPVVDLVIVGGPTHAHSFSSPATRREAARRAADPSNGFVLEPGAPGVGVREWIAGLGGRAGDFVAFDTRADVAALLAGSAAKHIQRALKKAGGHPIAPAQSFLVRDDAVEPAEWDRAEAWGEQLGRQLATRNWGAAVS